MLKIRILTLPNRPLESHKFWCPVGECAGWWSDTLYASGVWEDFSIVFKDSTRNIFGDYTSEKWEGCQVSCQGKLYKIELKEFFRPFLSCPCTWMYCRKKQRVSDQGGISFKKAKPTLRTGSTISDDQHCSSPTHLPVFMEFEMCFEFNWNILQQLGTWFQTGFHTNSSTLPNVNTTIETNISTSLT